jgi:hypothetical protein
MSRVHSEAWNDTGGSVVLELSKTGVNWRGLGSIFRGRTAMTSEIQIHTIARQMLERHGPAAIAHAAQNALSCEHKGQVEEANEWRHIKDAIKIMVGPHQS